MKDKILSIQSKLVYGYVGSNIAELAIQLHGLDVIAFPTVLLSAHTGHQPVHGMKIDKPLFEDLLAGIDNLKMMDSVINIITGYIGDKDVVVSAADYIKRIKTEFPDKMYICDPVMGDDEGLYVDEKLADAIVNNLLPLCDVLTPNHFEFEHIVGCKARTESDIIAAIGGHKILREKIILITSCRLVDTADDDIETLIVKGENCKRIAAKRIDLDTTGTGDLFTAFTASQLAMGRDIVTAVTESMQFIKRALDYTVEVGNVEMNAASLVRSMKR